jgi:hypothetical protein
MAVAVQVVAALVVAALVVVVAPAAPADQALFPNKINMILLKAPDENRGLSVFPLPQGSCLVAPLMISTCWQ